MTMNKSPKRTAPGAAAAGVKFLITAASLTAVVGGWAAFSKRDLASQQPASTSITESNVAVIVLPPLPTLVTQSRQVGQSAQPPSADTTTTSNQPAPAAPALRSVSIPQPQPSDNGAPPPPVTNTRSSR